MEDEEFAEALMRGFARAGVDGVFTGHIHASHRWVRDGIPYVVSGEGFTSPAGSNRNRMAWVHVRGWEVTIAQIPIWGPAYAELPPGQMQIQDHDRQEHREAAALLGVVKKV
jgi:hypothetical protein